MIKKEYRTKTKNKKHPYINIPIEYVSDCCGEKIINHDERGMGFCSNCHNHCEEMEE